MKKQGRYSNEFKDEVLRMAETTDKSLSELEQDLGLSHGLIRKWRQRYQVGPVEGELQRSPESELEAENRRLRRELEIVRQEREILKSATGVLAGSAAMKFAFIEARRGCFPVRRLCQVLGSRQAATMRGEVAHPVRGRWPTNACCWRFEPFIARAATPMAHAGSRLSYASKSNDMGLSE